MGKIVAAVVAVAAGVIIKKKKITNPELFTT